MPVPGETTVNRTQSLPSRGSDSNRRAVVGGNHNPTERCNGQDWDSVFLVPLLNATLRSLWITRQDHHE